MSDDIEEMEMFPDDDTDLEGLPWGDQYFDTAMRRLRGRDELVVRLAKREETARAQFDAEMKAWEDRKVKPAKERAELLRTAIEQRMLSYKEATGKKSYSGPFGAVKTREVDDWEWPTERTEVAELEQHLTDIDKVTFIRTSVAEAIDKQNVKMAALVKDGRVMIDGAILPHLQVVKRTKVDVKPTLRDPDAF